MLTKTQRIDVPGVGSFTAVWGVRGLYALHFPGAVPPIVIPRAQENEQLPSWEATLASLLRLYFAAAPVDFSGVPLFFTGYTPFQQRVLRLVRTVPYGEVVTYGQVAIAVGSPGGARAVGQAMGCNRTPVVIPCHRVVGQGGAIGGFSAGLSWKRRLLWLEGGSTDRE